MMTRLRSAPEKFDVMIHSITEDTSAHPAHGRDQMNAIKASDDYDTYRLLAVYLAYLDTNLDENKPPSTQPLELS